MLTRISLMPLRCWATHVATGVVVLLTCSISHAQTWNFEMMADTSTTVPGSANSFDSFTGVSIGSGSVAFAGSGSANGGIFRKAFGSTAISTVVDYQTLMPGSSETFGVIDAIAMDGDNIAFGGGNASLSRRGIYKGIGSNLSRVIDTTQIPPNGSGRLSTVGISGLSGSDVGFWGFVPFSPTFDGVYTEVGGSLSRVANEQTSIPGGTGTFSQILSNASFRDGDLAFIGLDASFDGGLYAELNGSLGLIANNATAIPGGNDNFNFNFGGDLAVADGHVTFVGSDGEVAGSYFEETGLYRFELGSLDMLLDRNSLNPEGSAYQAFLNVAVDGDDFAFSAVADDFRGLYARVDGQDSLIIKQGDLLMGKTIAALPILETQNFEDGRLAFRANFTDGSQGVFVASVQGVPEPSTSALMILAVLVVCSQRRRWN